MSSANILKRLTGLWAVCDFFENPGLVKEKKLLGLLGMHKSYCTSLTYALCTMSFELCSWKSPYFLPKGGLQAWLAQRSS